MHYPVDSELCYLSAAWIAIYPVDSVIHPLNNHAQRISVSSFFRGEYTSTALSSAEAPASKPQWTTYLLVDVAPLN